MLSNIFDSVEQKAQLKTRYKNFVKPKLHCNALITILLPQSDAGSDIAYISRCQIWTPEDWGFQGDWGWIWGK